MKKLWMILLLCTACTLVYADAASDFNALADGAAQTLPEGATLRRHAALRILFLDMPVQADSSSVNVNEARRQMLNAIKGSADAAVIKRSNIILIYNFITTDRKIFSVVISRNDL